MRQVVIIAGGKGTRLSSQFVDIPKSLVPINGKPLLAYQLEWAQRENVNKVEIFAGFLADKIVAYLKESNWPGLEIRVHIENEPLGNAGAVLRSLDQLENTFFVVYGDLLIDLNLSRLEDHHQRQQARFTAVVHPNDHPFDSDLFECDQAGVVKEIHLYPHETNRSLPNLVNAAVYAIERDLLVKHFEPGGKSDFTKNIIPELLRFGVPINTYRSNEYIKDVGTPDRLQKGEKDIDRGIFQLSGNLRKRAAIFLDRDGTLNFDDGQITRPELLKLMPGVPESLKKLRSVGFQLVIITNQPLVARGEASEEDIANIHQELEWSLGKERAYVDRIYYCPHHPDGGFAGERAELKVACECRKPGIALFHRACSELSIDPSRSWMIGDRTSDIEFANRAGLRSILVKTGDGGQDKKYDARPTFVASDLGEATSLICADFESREFKYTIDDSP